MSALCLKHLLTHCKLDLLSVAGIYRTEITDVNVLIVTDKKQLNSMTNCITNQGGSV